MLNSINRTQRLYVMKAGHGYSCLGFDVCEKRRAAILQWLGMPVETMRKGTKKHYAAYRAACDMAKARYDATGQKCPAELTPALRGLEGRRVAIVKDGEEISRFWVSRSNGWMPCHIEISRRGSSGGCAAYVPEGATVRIVA